MKVASEFEIVFPRRDSPHGTQLESVDSAIQAADFGVITRNHPPPNCRIRDGSRTADGVHQ
jgi:hypothetical protein